MDRMPPELEERLAQVAAAASDDGTVTVAQDGAVERLARRGMLVIERSYINGKALVALTPEGEDYKAGFLAALVDRMKEVGPALAAEVVAKLLGL